MGTRKPQSHILRSLFQSLVELTSHYCHHILIIIVLLQVVVFIVLPKRFYCFLVPIAIDSYTLQIKLHYRLGIIFLKLFLK